MIKTPLRYPGGKSKALKKIIPNVPEFAEYREPFLGGGSVFIYLKQKFPNCKFWINDLHKNLYYFWFYAQKNPKELLQEINACKKKFNIGKELYYFLNDNIESFDELKKAAAFFIYNRITFSGTSESGGFSNAAFTKRFTKSSLERVQILSTLLKENVTITNYDYEKLLLEDGKNVFIFLDPPYYSATKSALYGKNGNLHKSFDHKRFATILKETKHKWLITYDDSDYIRKLFNFANVKEWATFYGMRNVNKQKSVKQGKELFISNYEIPLEKENCQEELFSPIQLVKT